MPYGLPESDDTPANNAKMERCVKKVMSKQPDLQKSNAVAICKKSLGFTKNRVEAGDVLFIRLLK